MIRTWTDLPGAIQVDIDLPWAESTFHLLEWCRSYNSDELYRVTVDGVIGTDTLRYSFFFVDEQAAIMFRLRW